MKIHNAAVWRPIPQSISKHNIVSSAIIEDSPTIENLIVRITKTPANGDEMYYFASAAEKIDLKIHGKNHIQNIKIYEKKFKTPATGFNSGENEGKNEVEETCTEILMSALCRL